MAQDRLIHKEKKTAKGSFLCCCPVAIIYPSGRVLLRVTSWNLFLHAVPAEPEEQPADFWWADQVLRAAGYQSTLCSSADPQQCNRKNRSLAEAGETRSMGRY